MRKVSSGMAARNSLLEFEGNYVRVRYRLPVDFLAKFCYQEDECLYEIDKDGSYLIPRGFTASVADFLLSRGYTLPKTFAGFSLSILDEIKDRLRDYQVDIVKEALRFLRLQGAATIMMATGAGKTYTVWAIARILLDAGVVKRVFFVAHTIDLIMQAAEWADKWGIPDVSVIYGGLPVVTQRRAIAITSQTLYNLLTTNPMPMVSSPYEIDKKLTDLVNPLVIKKKPASVSHLFTDLIIDSWKDEMETYEKYSDTAELDSEDAQKIREAYLKDPNILVIFDETHHVPARTISTIALANPWSFRIGLSATPWRSDMRTLHIYATVGEVIPRIVTSSELIMRGYSVPIFIIGYIRNVSVIRMMRESQEIRDAKMAGEGAKLYQAVKRFLYKQDELRFRALMKIVKEIPKPGIIIAKEIEPAEKINDMLEKAGYKTRLFTGVVKGMVRKEVLDLMRNKQIDFAVTTTIANEGLDIPCLASEILLDGASSLVAPLQRIGRLTRPCEGKKYGVAVDFMDNIFYFRGHAVIRRLLYKFEPTWVFIKTRSSDGVVEALKWIKSLTEKDMAKIISHLLARRHVDIRKIVLGNFYENL